LGNAAALPFPDESFDGVAILYVLYHLSDLRLALVEANRVMCPGGLIAVAVPSRHDSPELDHTLPKTPLTFDAELASGLLREAVRGAGGRALGRSTHPVPDQTGPARLPRR